MEFINNKYVLSRRVKDENSIRDRSRIRGEATLLGVGLGRHQSKHSEIGSNAQCYKKL